MLHSHTTPETCLCSTIGTNSERSCRQHPAESSQLGGCLHPHPRTHLATTSTFTRLAAEWHSRSFVKHTPQGQQELAKTVENHQSVPYRHRYAGIPRSWRDELEAPTLSTQTCCGRLPKLAPNYTNTSYLSKGELTCFTKRLTMGTFVTRAHRLRCSAASVGAKLFPP